MEQKNLILTLFLTKIPLAIKRASLLKEIIDSDLESIL